VWEKETARRLPPPAFQRQTAFKVGKEGKPGRAAVVDQEGVGRVVLGSVQEPRESARMSARADLHLPCPQDRNGERVVWCVQAELEKWWNKVNPAGRGRGWKVWGWGMFMANHEIASSPPPACSGEGSRRPERE